MFKQWITKVCGRVNHCIEKEEGDEDVDEDGEIDEDDGGDDSSSGGTPAPSKERGRKAHTSFFFLEILPRWEKVPSLVHGVLGLRETTATLKIGSWNFLSLFSC